MAEDPDRLVHRALEGAGDCTLDEARLTDQQRLAVVLQGAALLSQLEHGGWFLPGAWDGVRLTDSGQLKAGTVRRGRFLELTQVLLGRLLRRLFRAEEIAGRGEARRAARHLASRWQQILAPSSADIAVVEVLEAAPFLWQPAFSEARAGLVGEHIVAGRSHLWVSGPGKVRRRVLAAGADHRQVAAVLVGPRARDVWEGWHEEADPEQLAGAGRWRRAVAAWRRRPPQGWQQTRSYARCLFALGRYSQVLTALKRLHRVEARLLRAWCQVHLGELNAAENTVRRLSQGELTPEETVELAEVAVRLAGNLGSRLESRDWAARCLAAPTRGELRLKANLVAAEAAFDCEDMPAMDAHLAASRQAREVPGLAVRWHHVRGLRSYRAAEGPGMVEHLSTALGLGRRRLSRIEAGRLWNDLALGRALADDLPGAERACRHALRLLGDCDGPSRIALLLYNLAEIRLRRGRVAGVQRILEASTRENRRSGNIRSLIRDLELWVRLELAQGRAVAALARCAEALHELDRKGLGSRRGIFEVLAARAHGWLGRRDKASACLERADRGHVAELEPEERPALWALAGQHDEALEQAAATRWAGLWRALVTGAHPGAEAWDDLDALEPFRAARLVFDCELILAGVVPPRRVRQAIVAFRRCGADALAERMESRSLGPWRALEDYLSRPAKSSSAVAELFAGAGYGDVSLSWIHDGREKVLISGAGGPEELIARVDGGRIVLRSRFTDSVLRTLFTLIREDLELPRRERDRRRAPADGIIGESSALTKSLVKLDRLAARDLPILILGESGTGKELKARRAHRASRRADGPFLAINCAALSETLIQSDLFGHVKGAFTGADRDRAGIFESARGGTVFLDEIGDLPLPEQGKLLRVLQEGEIRRVGESLARKVDVRIVAATHRDLEKMVQREEFRQDLFFRLKVATIHLPPLRERGDDVLLLADHFLTRRAPAARLSGEAKARLRSHPWPGNIRELENVLEVAATLTTGSEIGSEHLELPHQKSSASAGDYHQQVEELRRKLVGEALAQAHGNRSEAARRLGLSRQALSYLVRQLGLR